MKNEYKRRAEFLIGKKESINQELKNLAINVNPEKARYGWKRVIREDLGLVI